jgi:MFS family permease
MAEAQATTTADEREPRRQDDEDGRPLTGDEKRTVALLGIPTLALALSITVVTTYLPVVADGFAGSTFVIGVIVGLEGLVALWLPLLAGSWSDRLDTRIGGRLPFMVVGTPILIVGLLAMGIVSSVLMLGVAALVFFIGYFLAYEPYRALYPDAVGDEIEGRAQGMQALFRGAGTGLALLTGGFLLGIGVGAPFAFAAAFYVIAIAVFAGALARRGIPDRGQQHDGGLRESVAGLRELIRGHRELQAFLVANALWELSLGALKTFVFLYVSKGLGYPRTTTTLFIGGVAVIVLIAALVSGKLADRYGNLRVLAWSIPVYGIGFFVPFFFSTPWIIACSIPFVAIGGGVIMALPYSILTPIMPDADRGAVTGYYSFSRGIGTWLGPLFAGLAITALSGVFEGTQGYQAMWGVCAVAVLLSWFPLRRLRAYEREHDER